MARGFAVLEKIIVILSGYEFYQKVIVTSLIIAK
jgi:hypothetical protein